MTELMRNRVVFILVAVGAFILAFGLGQVAGNKKDAPAHHQKAAGQYTVKLLDGDVLKAKQPLRFEVLDPKGKPVTDFDTVHEKKLHLIVVDRDDLTSYEHLHPTMAAGGTWTVATSAPGHRTYRAYADFTPAGGKPQVAEADFSVGRTINLPATVYRPGDTASVDGYDVALTADGATYTFTVTKSGKPVDLEEYLGAGGHLVGIRTRSLDYLHAHASAAEANTVAFHVEAPNAGTWVLHLDFQVDGKVHDATFVQELEGAAGGMGEHMGDMGDMEGHGHDD